MVFGEERLFKTNALLKYKCEFFLRFMGKDPSGLKMRGTFPKLWKVTADQILGPQLVDEDSVYDIVNVDYNKSNLWLIPLS